MSKISKVLTPERIFGRASDCASRQETSSEGRWRRKSLRRTWVEETTLPPVWVLGNHLEDQFPNLLRRLFPPTCLWTLEISLQYIRKLARCQRTTVSGVTTRRACFHPDQTRRAITQKSLSRSPRLARGCRPFSMTSS